jgi:nucleotide-binding universal stress UspA family protein
MKRFSNILAVVNTSRNDNSALQRAVSVMNSNLASLTVASVVEELPADMWMIVLAVSPTEIRDIAAAEELERLEEFVTVVGGNEALIEKEVLVGRPFLEVIHQVLKRDHDLVIKNVEPSEGLLDVFFGSTDMHLMRKCPCPVWIIKPGHKHYRRILACIDFDPDSSQNEALNRQIIEIATSLAVAEVSELHIIHALEPFSEGVLRSTAIAQKRVEFDAILEAEKKTRERWLETLLDEQSAAMRLEDADFHKVQIHLIKGLARNVVPMKARELDADLIVMGTLSRTGIPGYFIGNTSESILSQVNCSVLTMKPPGFVSPITL